MINFKNKKILITGATGGIGGSLVKKFCSLGGIVLGTGTKQDKLYIWNEWGTENLQLNDSIALSEALDNLKVNADGLIAAIAQDVDSKDVLMMAWMNAESVTRTLETGRVTYWSRSRKSFWIKGESSGHVQKLVELRLDCDRDCLAMPLRFLVSLRW